MRRFGDERGGKILEEVQFRIKKLEENRENMTNAIGKLKGLCVKLDYEATRRYCQWENMRRYVSGHDGKLS